MGFKVRSKKKIMLNELLITLMKTLFVNSF